MKTGRAPLNGGKTNSSYLVGVIKNYEAVNLTGAKRAATDAVHKPTESV